MRAFRNTTSELAMRSRLGQRILGRFMRREDGTITTFALNGVHPHGPPWPASP